MDSNQGPSACKADALNQLSYAPRGIEKRDAKIVSTVQFSNFPQPFHNFRASRRYLPKVYLGVNEAAGEIIIPQAIQKPAPKSRMRKFLKIFLISFGIFIGILLLSAILIPLCFEGQIKRIFISELNKNLATPLVINQEDIDLTILSSFPNAAIECKNLAIRESVPGSKKNFAEAGSISLQFNIWDILKKKYIIKKISLSDATIRMITDKSGNVNYKFWKELASGSSGQFSVLLQAVNLSDINFTYTDFRHKQDIGMIIHKGTAKGNFTSTVFTLDADIDALSQRIKTGSNSYLVNREISAATQMNINTSAETYTIKKGKISVDKNDFLVAGSISEKNKTTLDLHIEGDNTELGALIALLPDSYAHSLSGIDSKGDLSFKAAIKGNYSAKESPDVAVTYSLSKGTLYNHKSGDKLTDVFFSGAYTNTGSSSFTIKNFKANHNGDPVAMELQYKNFKNPYIDLQVSGNIPAAILIPSIAGNTVTDVDGYFSLDNIAIHGLLRELRNVSASSVPTGTIGFHNVKFKSNGEDFLVKDGTASVNGNDISFANLSFEAAGSDLHGDLSFHNWLDAVFNASSAMPLAINGNIQSSKIDLGRIVDAFGTKKTSSPAKTSSSSAGNDRWLHVSGTITTEFSNLTWHKINVTNLKTVLKLSPDLIIAHDVSGETMDGNFNVTLSFRKLPSGNYTFETIGQLQSIDVTQLFEQFDNFGQTTITAKNLKGEVSAIISALTVGWDSHFHLNQQSVYAVASMMIKNGQLINYAPMEALSNYINVQDLMDIQFSDLQNEIRISDRTITIPAMQIRSSAMNVDLSGTHTFDNIIDYQVRISLAELLSHKFFGSHHNDDYESNGNGGISIYVSMTGTATNPVITYNKKGAKEKLKENGLEQNKFLDIFKNEPVPDDGKDEDKWKPQKNDDDEDSIEFIDFGDDGQNDQ